MDQLKLWLSSRNLPTSGLKAVLVGLVNAIKAAEDASGGCLHVRNPENVVTLGSLLQAGGHTEGNEQYDQSLTIPIGGWIEGMAELQVRAPLSVRDCARGMATEGESLQGHAWCPSFLRVLHPWRFEVPQ